MSDLRVLYREGQFLEAGDLSDEQAYRLVSRRRHNIGPHGWGILAGLELNPGFDPDGFAVMPGLAIDGFGRELVVSQAILYPWEVDGKNIFDRLKCPDIHDPNIPAAQNQYLDVWLRYQRKPAHSSALARPDCPPGRPDRWLEETLLSLTPVLKDPSENGEGVVAPANPRHPPGVKTTDLSFGPHQTPPEDGQGLWPVFLGRLKRVQYKGASVYSSVSAPRAEAYLLGETINAASVTPIPEDPKNPPKAPLPPVVRAQVQLSGESDTIRQRFTVRLPDEKGKLHPRLVLEPPIPDSPGRATFHGQLTLVSETPLITRARASDLVLAEISEDLVEDDLVDAPGLACQIPPDVLPQIEEDKESSIHPILFHKAKQAPSQLSKAAIEPETVFLKKLNLAMKTKLIFDPVRLPPARYSKEFWQLLDQSGKTVVRQRLNRLYLVARYSKEVDPSSASRNAHSLRLRPLEKTPEEKKPWSIYRTDVEGADGLKRREMRFEFDNVGDPLKPQRSQFAVGSSDADGIFKPCLEVNEACTVTIHGDLTIEGNLVRRPLTEEEAGSSPDGVSGGGAGGGALDSQEELLEELERAWTEGLSGGTDASLKANVVITNLTADALTRLWSYRVQVENTGTAPLSFVTLVESYAINGVISETHPIGGFASLLPGATEQIDEITHTDPLPAMGSSVSLTVTLIAYGPTFKSLYVSTTSNDTLP